MFGVTVNSAGLFVAVGIGSGAAPLYATSTNGSTWTTPARINGSTTPAYFYSVAVNSAGLFVAVGSLSTGGGPLYATSTNGSTWTTPALMNASFDAFLIQRAVAVNSSGLFVAVGYNVSTYPVYAVSTIS